MGETVGNNSSPSRVRNFNGVQHETMDGVAGRTANPTSRRTRTGRSRHTKHCATTYLPHFLTVTPDFASSLDETSAEGRTGESGGLHSNRRREDNVPSKTKGQSSVMASGCTPSWASTQMSARNQIVLRVRERFVDHVEFGPQPMRTITLGGTVRKSEPFGIDLLPTSNSHENPLLNFGSHSPPNMGGFYDPKKVSATLHTTLFFNLRQRTTH